MNLEQAKKRFVPLSETMLYILLSLQNEMHGYGIMQNVKALTDGRIELGAGTVYQTLDKLANGGLIAATDEKDRRKLYRITPVGTAILKEEKQRITEIYQNMERLV